MHRLLLIVLLLLVGITAILCDKTVTVTSATCGGSYSVDYGSLFLKYNGDYLPTDCKFTINGAYTNEICSFPEQFDISNCETTLEYHNYFYSTFSPDKSYDCATRQTEEFCSFVSTLVIAFKTDGTGSRSDNVELKIYSNEGYRDQVIDSVVTMVYVTIAVIIGVIVLIIVLVVVTIFCCCRRRQNQAGTVYRQPAAVTTTTAAYPMTQTGFQPVQGGYQPPPQTGYQPPPQTGYQPPPQTGYQPQPCFQQPSPQAPQAGGFTNMSGYQQPAAGYPPAPQQSYAGTGREDPEKASAPPPPYPGN